MKRKYKNMKILCLGKRTHTGLDVEVKLDGENFLSGGHIGKIIWEIGPIDWNKGYGRITFKGYNEKDTVINYQIKSIILEFKGLTIKSDNTSIGTSFYWDDEEITSKLSPTHFKWTASNASTINELQLEVC